MSEIAYTDTAPVYLALGAAVFEAQHLEEGLSLLLKVMDGQSGRVSEPVAAPLDTPDAPQTIGQLFREVRMRKYLTDAERTAIQAGVKERNLLIHAYWDHKRSLALTKPAGRAWIFSGLDRIREVIRRAGRIVDSIIDRYLKESGTSLHELSRPLWEGWEPGIEPPPDVLH
jgi:hypothetical protein